MELVMWIVVWSIAGVLAIVSIPVLVVGTWFVVMTVILGVGNAGIWLLDHGWRARRGGVNQPRFIRLPTSGLISEKLPISALPAAISVDRKVDQTCSIQRLSMELQS
jgi:hypothetical protein